MILIVFYYKYGVFWVFIFNSPTEEALALPGLHDQAVGYAVLHLMNILSPIRDLISELSRLAYGFDVAPFPQMQEFLEWIYDDRQYVLRKRKWP